jgi:NAD(P)-dependent dehydrogenase (short-subunit alcohol dehydrogenase family)
VEQGTGLMRRVVVVGVSRGIGRGLAEEHLSRGWAVTGTVRASAPHPQHPHLSVETLDTTDEAQLQVLLDRLPDRIDRVIVSAGVGGPTGPIGGIASEDFLRALAVNTLAPLRIVDRFADRVTPNGMLAVLSSSQASIARNNDATNETYRISKVGLNMGLKSLAVRRDDNRSYVAINPGWVRTAMGTDRAFLSVEQSVHATTDVLDRLEGEKGMHYLNYDGRPLPW